MVFGRVGPFTQDGGRYFSGGALVAVVLVASLVPGVAGKAETAVKSAPEKVVNGSAETSVEGWSANSEAGPVRISRETGLTTSFGASTAIELRRDGGTGSWAMAVGNLHDPGEAFVVGKVYRMQVWVRDLAPQGHEVGILLANPHFSERPTDESCYVNLVDDSWQLVRRTFVATSTAGPGTHFYLALPRSGTFAIQISGVSVRESRARYPSTGVGEPAEVLDFAGEAGSPPNPATWNRMVGGHGWGNGELQSYTASTRNAYLDGAGNLRIVVRKERTSGPDGIVREYSSSRLTTQNKVLIEPGSYVEALIRAPVGAGMWPAFWLAGANVDAVGWPACGELDIMEGAGIPETRTHTALHMASQADLTVNAQYGWGEAGGTIEFDAPIDVKPHRYGVYFDDSTVWFYVDRKVQRAVWAADALNSGRTWPFGQPLFITLNLAISNSSSVEQTTFPGVMTVGAISIWRGGVPANS